MTKFWSLWAEGVFVVKYTDVWKISPKIQVKIGLKNWNLFLCSVLFWAHTSELIGTPRTIQAQDPKTLQVL